MSVKKCYLFEMGNTVVLFENGLWYRRDRNNHKWIVDGSWMARYFDAQYDVYDIKYDEDEGRIITRK